MKQTPKKKEGIARLMKLASTNKGRMTAACTLSVLSSVCKIIPYFTIYKVVQALIRCYASGRAFSFADVRCKCGIIRRIRLCFGNALSRCGVRYSL